MLHGSGATNNKVHISVHFQPNSNEICRYNTYIYKKIEKCKM